MALILRSGRNIRGRNAGYVRLDGRRASSPDGHYNRLDNLFSENIHPTELAPGGYHVPDPVQAGSLATFSTASGLSGIPQVLP